MTEEELKVKFDHIQGMFQPLHKSCLPNSDTDSIAAKSRYFEP